MAANMVRDIATLKRYFETNDRPSQQQFWDLLDTIDYIRALAVGSVGPLLRSQNLSDLPSPAAARAALNVYSKDDINLLFQQNPLKDPVKCVADANILLEGTGQTIDGVITYAGDRILVIGQTSAADNGIYVVSASPWSRSDDANTSLEVYAGMSVFSQLGTSYSGRVFALATSVRPVVLGTTPLTFAIISGAVYSVAGRTGDVTLTTDDVAEGASRKYFRAQVYQGTLLSPVGVVVLDDVTRPAIYVGGTDAGTLWKWVPGSPGAWVQIIG